MVLSMTGFALKTLTLSKPDGSQAHLTMNLKSLNSRFFEATCKIPNALQHLEIDCIKLLKERLIRGHITFTIHLDNPVFFKGPIKPELPTIKSYLTALDSIKHDCAIPGTLTISDIIQLPNIFIAQEHLIEGQEKEKLMAALSELTDQLLASRKLEGKALEKDLEQRCTVMNEEISKLEQAAERCMKERKEKIGTKLEHLDTSNQELADMQRTTLYMELDKIDIHEEIIRFKNHLSNFIASLKSPDIEKGRRLDFILQELAREANTMAAKAADSAISAHAINIKVELEKAREQVQNIV